MLHVHPVWTNPYSPACTFPGSQFAGSCTLKAGRACFSPPCVLCAFSAHMRGACPRFRYWPARMIACMSKGAHDVATTHARRELLLALLAVCLLSARCMPMWRSCARVPAAVLAHTHEAQARAARVLCPHMQRMRGTVPARACAGVCPPLPSAQGGCALGCALGCAPVSTPWLWASAYAGRGACALSRQAAAPPPSRRAGGL